MKDLLVTNNTKVYEKYYESLEVVYLKEGTYLDVLLKSRDYIHKGCKLLTHPLSGSVKPNETPYKSILIKKGKGILDMDSLSIIEKSIQTFEKLRKDRVTPKWTKNILEDFQVVDQSIIDSGISSVKEFF